MDIGQAGVFLAEPEDPLDPFWAPDEPSLPEPAESSLDPESDVEDAEPSEELAAEPDEESEDPSEEPLAPFPDEDRAPEPLRESLR